MPLLMDIKTKLITLKCGIEVRRKYIRRASESLQRISFVILIKTAYRRQVQKFKIKIFLAQEINRPICAS